MLIRIYSKTCKRPGRKTTIFERFRDSGRSPLSGEKLGPRPGRIRSLGAVFGLQAKISQKSRPLSYFVNKYCHDDVKTYEALVVHVLLRDPLREHTLANLLSKFHMIFSKVGSSFDIS